VDQIASGSVALQSLRPTAPSAKVAFDAAAVQAVVKQLKALEKAPSFLEQVAAAKAYYADLQSAYQASIRDAASQTEMAKSTAGDTDKDIVEKQQSAAK
jgi:hypothetical protein